MISMKQTLGELNHIVTMRASKNCCSFSSHTPLKNGNASIKIRARYLVLVCARLDLAKICGKISRTDGSILVLEAREC